MRYLLIFFSVFSFGQPEPVGNIVFTDAQKAVLQLAFASPSTSFPDNATGYFDDIADINTRAEQFRSDMAGSGVDRGAFDWFHNGTTFVPRYSGDAGSPTQDPFPPNWPTYGKPANSNRNIHSAAIKAYATDDSSLALHVFNALVQRANDLNLDFSNGGTRRISGEPPKTNATYGTSERFPFERQENFRSIIGQNPHFMLASKMEQYAISYSIIYDLVSNTGAYATNGDIVNYWFHDFYRYIKFSADLHTNYWLGANWRNFQQDWARPTNVFSSIPAYSGPSTVLYTTSDAAAQGITNRSADGFSYIHFFGELFDIAEGKAFGYDVFRAMLAICVFPDGTFHEHYRWDANPDYVYTHIIKYAFMAHTNEVAVERGYLPSSDNDKFYGYSSSLGTNELFNGATFSSTSGGPKTLRLILENLSRYYRLPANGGYEGLRYRANGSPYTTSHVQNIPQAIFLSRFPNDTAIDDFKNYRASAGYTSGLNPNMQANGDGPHSLGTAWGFGNAIGGHIAFGTFDAFGATPPPPTSPNAARRRAFYKNFFNN